MSDAYVLTILVTSGDPDGVRVVEKSNWSGRGVVFGRSDLGDAAAQGISSPGIYVLIGEDPDGPFDQRIYVGQGEEVGKRLAQHQRDESKDFWNNTVVFVSKDGGLNRAHILHLEARLLELADASKRVAVANGNRPSPPLLSPSANAEAEGFLREMLAIFPVLGLAAFEKPGTAGPALRRRYFLKGPDAEGEGEDRPDGFLVLANANARIEDAASLSPSFGRLRARLLASGHLIERNGVYEMADDYLFKSPSTAAMVLLGRNANGRTEWKDSDGVTLKEHQDAAADAAVAREVAEREFD